MNSIPLPLIKNTLDIVYSNKVFLKIDQRDAFNQIRIKEEHRENENRP